MLNTKPYLDMAKVHFDTGRLDHLVCPECNAQMVSVSFTRSGNDRYCTYFDCSACGNVACTSHAEEPEYFDSSRIDPRHQEFEDRASRFVDSATEIVLTESRKGKNQFSRLFASLRAALTGR